MAVRSRKTASKQEPTKQTTSLDKCKSRTGMEAWPLSNKDLMVVLSMLVGTCVMIGIGYTHAKYMATIHENWMWFSNIKEVEREISFRTESGLYYSYYKQMVNAPSITQGLYALTHDNMTEHPATINVLERMNIYQEVILSILYRILPVKNILEPVYFYINTVFALHGMLVCALFVISWMLSGSWLSGALTGCFYIFNRLDTTRVEYVIPLRESFSLPFLWLQIAGISLYFKHNSHGGREKLSLCIALSGSFLFCLFWQFNQFVMLLQSLALFGVWILDLVPANKVRMILLFNAVSLLSVCVLQSVNTMILGSLVMSFIPATFLLMYFKGDSLTPCSIPARISKVAFYSITSIILMFFINIAVKTILNLEADEHIFKFLLNKFGIGNPRDFDSRLYLCIEAFGFLQLDTFERMSKLLVFPIYLVTHLTLLAVLFIAVMQNWSNHSHEVGLKDHPSPRHSHLLSSRPDLAFHAIQAMFFGALGMSTLRMKYLWTPYMCILAGFGVGDYRAWKNVLARLRINQDTVVQIARHLTTIAVLALLFAIALPPALKGLEDLKEFWDPDTVELMEWIKKSTPPTAALSGSMQLMAGVKLCTGRPITNHPHYEDKILRIKTKELYQYYAKRDPADVHALMKKYKTDYIILEDSICLAPSRGGCRLPDILDVDNGVIPDSGISEPGLVKSNIPRFCDEVRRQTPEYAKYFKHVFTNKTFRIYKIV
ncbi:probable C-mannosyltransferase DPY19L3 isoform X1 [Mya arenaria]|uniref:probable C-mannosyltransferase DPY19L3 isoform X1 n=1 Tax=Mya arenaria TaxID=6604 RepID=UPI0022E8C2D8|nr:probable C-mannosyltransferase DPY19L3 isoform X1 [Mya arenaria]XP_052810569.1 probable C-mannosyltransferase DPY19L3 isoform X1 [Mya arenaria]